MAAAMTSTTTPAATTSKMMWFKTPPAVYFGWGGTQEALRDLPEARITRAFIVTDRNVHAEGYDKIVIDRLVELEIEYEIFYDVTKPTANVVAQVVANMNTFSPDCLIALGGGSVMDVTKICRVIYDPGNKATKLSDLYAYDHMQLLSDREEKTGVSRLPPADSHIKKLVCIPTTSGTGSEMTPVAWVEEEESEDKKLALKRPIITWRMTPDMAINDGYFTSGLSKRLAASGGLNAFTCAVESAVSRLSNDYTFALSTRAALLLWEHLPSSVDVGDQTSRAHCHNGASIAGMAAANAFVGVAHALSFVLQRFFQRRAGKVMHQGLTSALVLGQVILFNSTRSAEAARKYALISDMVGTGGVTDATMQTQDVHRMKAKALAESFGEFKSKLGVEKCVKDVGVPKDEFDQNVDRLAAETLKVVGCTATNPIEVTEADAKMLLLCAFDGSMPQ